MSLCVYEPRSLLLSVKPIDVESMYGEGFEGGPLPRLIRTLLDAPAGSPLGETAVDDCHCEEYPRPKLAHIGPHTYSVEICVPEDPGYAAMVASAKHAFEKAGWLAEVL